MNRLLNDALHIITLEEMKRTAILVVYSDTLESGQLEWFLQQLIKQFGQSPVIVGLPSDHRIETLTDDQLEQVGLVRIPDHPAWETAELGKDASIKVMAAYRRKKSEW